MDDDLSQLTDEQLQQGYQQAQAHEAAQPVAEKPLSALSDADLQAGYAAAKERQGPEYENRLNQARQFVGQNMPAEEPTLHRLGRTIGATTYNALMNHSYGVAKQRFDDRTANDADLQTIAEYEHAQGWRQQGTATVGGALGEAALGLPEQAAQFMAGGMLLKGVGTGLKALGLLGETAAPATALGRVGLGAAKAAASTPAVPALYLDRWQQNNIQAGRNPEDVRGLPNALILAGAQNAVLGMFGEATAPLFAGKGIAGAAGRVGVNAAAGPFVQMAADAATSAAGLDTGYGAAGLLAQGKNGEAAKHLIVTSMTFAAFSGQHEFMRGIAGELKAQADRGVPVSEAAKNLQPKVDAAVKEAAEADTQTAPQPAKPEAPQSTEGGEVAPQAGIERPPAAGEAETPPTDRRKDASRRQRVADMTPEERAKELLTSEKTGLPNRRAFDEAGPAPAVGMSDADGLKALNDKFGYDAGDALLRAKADALREVGLDAYHEKGDEFLYRGGSPEEIAGKLEQARAIMREKVITAEMTDGSVRQFQGADFSHGVGTDLASAESNLKAHKAQREAAGERARGELRGIAEVEPGQGQANPRGAARPNNVPPPERPPGLTPPVRREPRPAVPGGAGAAPPPVEGAGTPAPTRPGGPAADAGPPTAGDQLSRVPEQFREIVAGMNDADLFQFVRNFDGSIKKGASRGQMLAVLSRGRTPTAAEVSINRSVQEQNSRVEQLVGQGWSRSAAEERVQSENAPRQETAMGAAALGELTGENPQPGIPRTRSLTHAQSDADRLALGLTEAAKRGGFPDKMVHAAATAAIQADPEYPDRLIGELEKKNRPLDPVDMTVLTMHGVRLAHDIDQTNLMIEHAETHDGMDAAGYRQQALDLLKQHDRYLAVADKAGSITAAGLGIRARLMADDYSFVGMVRRAKAAKGGPLTEAETAKLRDLANRLQETQPVREQTEQAYVTATAPKSETESPMQAAVRVSSAPETKAMTAALVADRGVKAEAGEFIEDLKAANRPVGRKWGDAFLAWQRFSLLSGVKTLGKIASASVETLAVNPLKEIAGAAWGWIPGISRIAAKAQFEGGISGAGELKSAGSYFTQGMIDGYEKLTSGRSALETQYGKAASPGMEGLYNSGSRSWLDLPQDIHASIKAPALRAAYERLFLKGLEAEFAAGKDATTPATLARVGAQAFLEAHRSIFMESNVVPEAVNRAIEAWRSPQASMGSQIGGTIAKSLLPIVKVPTNVVYQAFEAAFGVIPGLGRAAAVPFRGGMESLTPKQADLIMRQLKAGSIGGAMFLLGALAPKNFGGFYTNPADEKKRQASGDVPVGAARVAGITLPAWTQHNPVLLAGQIGASFRRTLDKTYRGQEEGVADAMAAAVVGMAKETPLLEQPGRLIESASSPHGRGRIFGQYLAGLTVPRAVQEVAQITDSAEKRKPTGTFQQIEAGIPGLRQTVPTK